jgi:chloramphenicol 3-O phosphotransferase
MITRFGSVIFLNGASSSGKSTIAREIQKVMSIPYLYLSFDAFIDQLPEAYRTNEYLLVSLPQLLAGFHASSVAIIRAGNNVIIDHGLQEPSWVLPCVRAFDGVKVFFVGVRCSLDVLETREKRRGDRTIGTARYQHKRIHTHDTYDIQVDTSEMSIDECVSKICGHVKSGRQPSAFKRLRKVI